MGSYTSIILIVVMIIAFYFLIMRPQRKRQQQQQDMMRKLEPGTRVVTTTGIYATIVAMGDKQVVLETSPGSQVVMLKQAIGRVVGDEEEDPELGNYRAGGAAGAGTAGNVLGQPVEQAPVEQPGASSASGLAGGAPIQEYTPGNGPDFEPAADDSNPHETAPWPPVGTPEPQNDGPEQGSTLGNSALGESYGHNEDTPESDAAGEKKDESGR
ncbi:MAG TPA: preprotein translocase subunit YajC [Microlunatus sp.]